MVIEKWINENPLTRLSYAALEKEKQKYPIILLLCHKSKHAEKTVTSFMVLDS